LSLAASRPRGSLEVPAVCVALTSPVPNEGALRGRIIVAGKYRLAVLFTAASPGITDQRFAGEAGRS
jgi:hypothetical protein